MASVKNFKKEINYILSDIIEECYICQLTGDDKVSDKADKIINEAITTFDDIIVRLHEKNVDNKKKHYQSIRAELSEKSDKMMKKIEKLTV